MGAQVAFNLGVTSAVLLPLAAVAFLAYRRTRGATPSRAKHIRDDEGDGVSLSGVRGGGGGKKGTSLEVIASATKSVASATSKNVASATKGVASATKSVVSSTSPTLGGKPGKARRRFAQLDDEEEDVEEGGPGATKLSASSPRQEEVEREMDALEREQTTSAPAQPRGKTSFDDDDDDVFDSVARVGVSKKATASSMEGTDGEGVGRGQGVAGVGDALATEEDGTAHMPPPALVFEKRVCGVSLSKWLWVGAGLVCLVFGYLIEPLVWSESTSAAG